MQIISGRGINGALMYCKILSEELGRRGHDVTLVCRPRSWMASNVDNKLVKIIRSSLSRFPLTQFKRISKVIRNRNIDLIHTHMTRGQNFGIGLKWMTGVPVVATAHNRNFEVHWKFNDFVIANSKSTFDYHRRVSRISSRKMATIYCCPDFERLKTISPQQVAAIRSQLKLEDDDLLITIIGEISRRKGQIHVVRALPHILRQHPNAKIIMVGRFGRRQSHVQKIRQFILDHRLTGKIKWAGRRSNIADYLSASSLVVMPSLEEPLGLVAVEALAMGTPIVASDTGGLKEIIRHRETGLLVPPGDSNEIAAAVLQLYGDEQLRANLTETGRQFVADRFSTKHLVGRVEDVYESVLADRKAA